MYLILVKNKFGITSFMERANNKQEISNIISTLGKKYPTIEVLENKQLHILNEEGTYIPYSTENGEVVPL